MNSDLKRVDTSAMQRILNAVEALATERDSALALDAALVELSPLFRRDFPDGNTRESFERYRAIIEAELARIHDRGVAESRRRFEGMDPEHERDLRKAIVDLMLACYYHNLDASETR